MLGSANAARYALFIIRTAKPIPAIRLFMGILFGTERVCSSDLYPARRLATGARRPFADVYRRVTNPPQVANRMPLVFPKTANPAQTVGRTPWSGCLLGQDALVPRLEQLGQHHAKRAQADGGVGRGPGGPPHNQCRLCDTGKNEWHWVANLPHIGGYCPAVVGLSAYLSARLRSSEPANRFSGNFR